MASTACSTTLGLNDVTKGDGGGGELDRISALEDKLATMQDTQDAILDALKPVVFRASLGTPQPVQTGVDTIVAFDKVELDTHRAFDASAHQYVIPVSGQYLITATVGYSMIDKARANCEIWVKKQNQPEVGQTAVTTPGNASGIGNTVLRVASATVVQLAAGDRVYIKAFHDYVTDLGLTNVPRETNLQIIRIPSMN
jgi:hypothetical protein